MNIYTSYNPLAARVWAVLVMIAMIISAFGAPFSVAFAEDEGINGEEQFESQGDEVNNKKKDKDDKKEEDKEPKKVDICHANESNQQANNPFNKLKVDIDGLNGHGGHADDIIPVVDGFPTGQNLNTVYAQFGGLTGQQILNDGCKTPGEVLSAQPVSPILECVEEIGQGQYRAHFGYENPNTYSVDIPVGNENKFTGGGVGNEDQGQPTAFEYPAPNYPSENRKGRTGFYPDSEFSVVFDGTNLVWTLNGKTSTANSGSKACPAPEPEKKVTIVATKIVCEDEALLPNWGNGAPDITASTANDFLNSSQERKDGCRLAPDWQFQWTNNKVLSKDVNQMAEFLPGWNTSDFTDGTGSVTIDIPVVDLPKDNGHISFREAFKSGYIPFTRHGVNNGSDVSAEIYCHVDNMFYDNSEWIQGTKAGDKYHCVAWNVPVYETIDACKYDVTGAPLAGWEMTATNGDEEMKKTTDKTGCVSFDVNPYEGPWSVSETMKQGWEQSNVGVVLGEVLDLAKSDDQYCRFFGLTNGDAVLARTNYVEVSPNFKCSFTNEFITPCEDKLNGDWANEVVESNQLKLKNGNPITDANRTDATKVLGVNDWTSGGSTGFFSLGFGGSVVVKFDNFVPNVAGDDIEIYEATNGSYPAETALVEVSQNGTDWFPVGTASNQNAGKISKFDFDSTGLAWIKYVRVTDTSNPALHTNDADGFDLDAIKATQSLCEKPTPTPMCTVTIVSDETNTVNGVFAKLVAWFHPDWTAIVNAPSKWIWGDVPVVDPVGETIQTFKKQFGWNGPVTSAILTIAADNTYDVTVNNTYFGGDASEKNFLTADVHDLTALIAQGNNTLEVEVKNLAQANGTEFTNPAGLKYELVITGTDEACDVPYEDPQDPENPDLTETTGGRSSGGGGVAGARFSSSDDEEQSGGSLEEVTVPDGVVLGDQVSAVPYGGANAGAGGTQVGTVSAVGLVLLALLGLLAFRRHEATV